MARYKRLTLVTILVLNVIFLFVRENQLLVLGREPINEGNPIGAYQVAEGLTIVRDFHMHRAYIERIWGKVAPRPYTMEGQEIIFRDWAPRLTVGMPHAYSPTAAILGWPFVFIFTDVQKSYFVYVALNLFGLFVLYQFYFFPRIHNYYALGGAAIIGVSACLIGTIAVGQTAVTTLCALALTWHLLYDPEKKILRLLSMRRELALGLILFLSTAKPQFAVLFGAILLGARSWRSVALGGVLFVLTCFFMAPYYGGWPTWIVDYRHFLSHYYYSGMSPFFRPCFGYQTSSGPAEFLAMAGVTDSVSGAIFQPLNLAVAMMLTVLAWRLVITPSVAFQLQIVNLLLLSPYLRLSEDILILLLIAEGHLLGVQSKTWESIKLILLICIVNSRECGIEQIYHFNPAYSCKLIFALLMIAGMIASKRRERKLGPLSAAAALC